MAHAPLRRSALARALLATLLVLGVTGCGGEKNAGAPAPASIPSASVEPEVPKVTATGLPTGVELEVTDSVPGVESGDSLGFVSLVYSLYPAGPLTHPATFTMELENALPASTPIVVATRESASKPWSYLPAKLTSDLRHVQFRTKNITEVGALTISLDAAVASLTADVRKAMVTGTETGTQRPLCDGPPEARKNGYSVAGTKGQVLFWCFGVGRDERVLTVVNRRKFPIQVQHPKLPTLSRSEVAKSWTLWTEILPAENTFLPPGGIATYNADLEPTTSLTISAQSDPTIQSLRLLQAGTRALVLQLARFGAGRANVMATVQALLTRPQCAKALGRGSDALVAGCFAKAKLLRTFGPRAWLLAPMVSSTAFTAFFRQQGQALTAEARTLGQQRIVVKRAAPDFTGFAGLWAGKTRLLTINGDGVATEKVMDETGKAVINLTYRLTEPDPEVDVSTADAAVTRVKVFQRKLVNGRVPRVGDKGVLHLRGGVITSPFLKTGYCNGNAAKKGVCGR
jgi:hypothetical protein